MSYGSCYKCNITWDQCKGHATPINKSESMFPLCEKCWIELTPEQRLPFYYKLIGELIGQLGSKAITKEEIISIHENVLAGL
jgi:hypothetical protein